MRGRILWVVVDCPMRSSDVVVECAYGRQAVEALLNNPIVRAKLSSRAFIRASSTSVAVGAQFPGLSLLTVLFKPKSIDFAIASTTVQNVLGMN